MQITNEDIYEALKAMGLTIEKACMVTPEKQLNYLLVSTTELPPHKDEPRGEGQD